MNKKITSLASIVFLALAIWGVNPFAPYRDTSQVLAEVDSYTQMESGVYRQGNGIYRVKALTRMPKVKAHMVRWWFVDYMQTSEHYKMWHPSAHVWMDWENKVPGKIIGASHLVDEYIQQDMSKLRIQFVDPAEFLDDYEEQDGRFVICARVGLREEPINMTSMCHVVRDTLFGAEMRSHFWLGHIAKRDGNNDEVFSMVGLLGNTALLRMLVLNEELAVSLMKHAIQEMGNLADFLPDLYQQKNSMLSGSQQ